MENAFAFFSFPRPPPCHSNVGSARMHASSVNQKDVRERKQQGLCCQTADVKKNTPNREESLAEFSQQEKNTCPKSCTFVLVHKYYHTGSIP